MLNSLFLHFNETKIKLSSAASLGIFLFFSMLAIDLTVASEELEQTQQQLDKITNIIQQIESDLAKNVNNPGF